MWLRNCTGTRSAAWGVLLAMLAKVHHCLVLVLAAGACKCACVVFKFSLAHRLQWMY